MSHEDLSSNLASLKFDDLKSLTHSTPATKVESTVAEYGSIISKTVRHLEEGTACEDVISSQLARVCDMMDSAWKVDIQTLYSSTNRPASPYTLEHLPT